MIIDISPISRLLIPDRKIILASKSPRRKKLMEQLGFDIEIIPADLDEDSHTAATPQDFVLSLSSLKAQAIAEQIDFPAYIIGADTIVVLDNTILNKPVDSDDAVRMLQTLSGRTHTVFTGVTIVSAPEMKSISKFKSTEVTFRDLDISEIKAYVATGSPLDKAGAYGIQDDFGAVFVSHVDGCYYNIVGLPLEMTYSMLKEIMV